MEKIIYTNWVAGALCRRGFWVVREEANPRNPRYKCWVFEETPELLEALTDITQQSRK